MIISYCLHKENGPRVKPFEIISNLNKAAEDATSGINNGTVLSSVYFRNCRDYNKKLSFDLVCTEQTLDVSIAALKQAILEIPGKWQWSYVPKVKLVRATLTIRNPKPGESEWCDDASRKILDAFKSAELSCTVRIKDKSAIYTLTSDPANAAILNEISAFTLPLVEEFESKFNCRLYPEIEYEHPSGYFPFCCGDEHSYISGKLEPIKPGMGATVEEVKKLRIGDVRIG
jgi:hypothetical protein